MRWMAALLLLLPALAGCSDGGSDGGADLPGSGLAEPPRLEATETTGVLRGVVVDEAVRPIGNASVSINGPSGDRNATTGDDGFFGFQGLQPGTYFVRVSKIAHETAQASAEVVAGLDDPPIVKVQLVFVPSEAPFVTELKVEGFAECIVPGANVCFIANFYPCLLLGLCDNVTNDNSVFHVVEPITDQQRHPDWTQIEVVWQSTQPVTDWLAFRISPYHWDDGGGVDERAEGTYGESPVVFTLNRAEAEGWDLGTEKGFAVETFSGGNDATCTGPQMDVINTCSSLGVVLNQQVDYYFHLFYGYMPPEGWQFSASGMAPRPPE